MQCGNIVPVTIANKRATITGMYSRSPAYIRPRRIVSALGSSEDQEENKINGRHYQYRNQSVDHA